MKSDEFLQIKCVCTELAFVRQARGKHSSLLLEFVNYDRKKFYIVVTRSAPSPSSPSTASGATWKKFTK